MNKIFKVVWSKVKHCYVVVSEIAKNTTSGGARRSRVRKGALAAALVTAVLTGSFAMPNSALAASGVAEKGEYVAIKVQYQFEDEQYRNGVYEDLVDSYGPCVISNPLPPDVDNNYVRVAIGDVNGVRADYFIRKGFEVVSYEANNNAEDFEITEVKGSVQSGSILANTLTRDDDLKVNNTAVTTVLGDVLRTTTTSPYVPISNGGGVEAYISGTAGLWEYYIDANGDGYGETNANASANTSGKLFSAVESKDGQFYLDNNNNNTIDTGEMVSFENVYFLKTNSNTDGVNPYVFFKTVDDKNDGDVSKIYTGNVTGGTGELLLTAQRETASGEYEYVTYWAGKATDSNSLLADSGMTVGEFNHKFEVVDENFVKLGKADIKEITIDSDAKTVSLIRNNDVPVGNSLVFGTGGGKFEDDEYVDTYVTIGQVNGSSVIKLNTGSLVEGSGIPTPSDENVLALDAIEINGQLFEVPVVNANVGATEADNYLTSIELNGKTYNIVSQGSSTDYSIVGEKVIPDGDNNNGSEVQYSGAYTVENDAVKLNLIDNLTQQVTEDAIVINDIASASKLNEIKNVVDRHENQLTGTVMYDVQGDSYNYNSIKLGETNTTDYDRSNKSGGVKVTNVAYADDDDGSAAVNVDLLNDKISAVATEAAKATTVSGDANVTVQESGNNNGGKNYAVSLNNDITLSTKDKDNNETGKVEIKSSDSTISVGKTKEVVIDGGNSKITVGTDSDHQVVIDGGAGTIIAGQKVAIDGSDGDATFGEVRIDGTTGDITAGKVQIDGDGGTITGLTNTTWNGTTDDASRAATEGQLQSAVTQVKQYVSANDKHIDYNKTYAVANDKITLDVTNSNGKTVVINDVASAAALRNEVAERKEADEALGRVNARQDSQIASLQAVNLRQDEQISNLQFVNDRQDTQIARIQENVAQEIIDRQNNDIVSGKIDDKGKVTLTKGNNKTIEVGTISDYRIDEQVQTVTDGKITLKVTDKYNSDNTYNVEINDVASASVVGAATKESLKESYKNTTYLQATKAEDGKEVATESLVEADVKLDAAIKANADLSYSNDVVLQNQIKNVDSRINQLGSKVNKVGAGAAALAALHPMDFDPDDKLSFAVGAGNYAGETATALGAFYRPNEKVMMNVAGTYGNGENMVNMGVSFALDRTNNVSNSRTAMAREIVDLREQVATQGQQIAQLIALVNQLAGTPAAKNPAEVLFPDIPENHWAYEYIHSLAARGIVEGYPDGNFGGDRTMTRYEFATMLFKAMQNGVVLSEQIRQEFEKELGRIRVDRVKGTDDDANKIERVRVNADVDRDDYGSKVVQVKH